MRFQLKCLLLPALLWMSPAEAAAPDAFYITTALELPGIPGTLIRSEPLRPPDGASAAFRILYRSLGLKGEPIAVSGIVVLPKGWAPPGGRPVVAWAHGTSGIARHCAPSLDSTLFQQIEGLPDLLARGYVVTASDYPGLGTAGVHPYLIGSSQGRAVLDSVRAARELPGANASARFIPWGYSQGGHASLFAATMAKHYAPELKLVSIAAAAPPTELGSLIRDDEQTMVGRILAAFALRSWSQLYAIPAGNFLKHNADVLIQMSQQCSMNLHEDIGLAILEQPFEQGGFLSVDVTLVQPWRALLDDNTPGITPPGVPVFIAQGASDAIVRPNVTQLYADELCSHNVKLHFALVPNTGHREIGKASAKLAVSWMGDRFDGKPAPTDCRDGLLALPGRR